MPDLKVDYSLLESSHGSLNSLINEFGNLQATTGSYDGALGSGDVASAMDGFAGNWNYHKNQLINDMKDLDKMVTESIDQFKGTDLKAAKELTGK